jgi:hypothetical protein
MFFRPITSFIPLLAWEKLPTDCYTAGPSKQNTSVYLHTDVPCFLSNRQLSRFGFIFDVCNAMKAPMIKEKLSLLKILYSLKS